MPLNAAPVGKHGAEDVGRARGRGALTDGARAGPRGCGSWPGQGRAPAANASNPPGVTTYASPAML